MNLLEVKNVVKDFGSLRAVNNVSFEIKEGEIFGLLGPNGAGKTTLISIIVTLEKATQGKVHICDYDIHKDPRKAKSLVGFMPQELIMHGYFNVKEIVEFYSGYCGVWPDQNYIEFLMKKLSLWERRNDYVRTLSGGMKRRLLILKALVHKPRLILLDEPTAGVDLDLRATIWSFIKELKDQGLSILFTTHYLEEAEQLCDRVAFIHKGEIRQVGRTEELISLLTTRKVYITFKQNFRENFKNQKFLGQDGNVFSFLLPYSQTFGSLMKELAVDWNQVADVKIREGSLEDVFKSVLEEK